MANRETPSDDRSSNSERPRADRNTQPPRTPATDMQPEDAGTDASGTESAMKQQQKTSDESGSSR